MHLNETRLFVQLGDEAQGESSRWILDSGATNHMTGQRSVFAEIDTKVQGSIHFGDGSVAGIEGRGTILLKCKTGGHKALTGVYFIPRLTTNIVSLGQLEEYGYKIMLYDGCLKLWDTKGSLVAKVVRAPNRLYVLRLNIDRPVCLAAQGENEAWRWHARYGHLNFHGLRRLAEKEMVKGMPKIDKVDQVCDGCLAGKQRRSPFPNVAKFRAKSRLELVHGDPCGPVTPSTPSGKKYFFLLVDDLSRYMWLLLLDTKDGALDAFTKYQARAEAEAGRRLGTLRTDRGGEFTGQNFVEHCTKHGIQ
jgi:hypothetical protein